MMAQRGIEDLYEFGHTLEEDHINVRIGEIYNNIRNMINRRRVAEQRHVLLPVIQQRIQYSSVNPIVNKKVLSKVALNTPCAEQCSICFDTHKKVDSLTTDCNHEFGSVCYNSWIRTHNSCPICRHICESVTVYKGRSSRIEVIELDD